MKPPAITITPSNAPIARMAGTKGRDGEKGSRMMAPCSRCAMLSVGTNGWPLKGWAGSSAGRLVSELRGFFDRPADIQMPAPAASGTATERSGEEQQGGFSALRKRGG